MRKHGTPAARFGFSSDSGSGAGSQNHEANRVECDRDRARSLIAVAAAPASCGGGRFFVSIKVDGPQARGYNEDEIHDHLFRRRRSER